MNKVKCSFAPCAPWYQCREGVAVIGLLRVRNVVKVHSHGNNNKDITISVACVGLMVSHAAAGQRFCCVLERFLFMT